MSIRVGEHNGFCRKIIPRCPSPFAQWNEQGKLADGATNNNKTNCNCGSWCRSSELLHPRRESCCRILSNSLARQVESLTFVYAIGVPCAQMGRATQLHRLLVFQQRRATCTHTEAWHDVMAGARGVYFNSTL
jgi:hypothetical protein